MPEGGFFSFAEMVPDRNREALAQAGPMISYKRPEERIIVESSVPVSPGEQALAQSRQTDGDSGLGDQGQAKKIPGFSLCFGNEATRISPKIFSSDPDQEIGDAGRTGC